MALCFCAGRSELAPSCVPGYPEAKAAALTWSWISAQLVNLKAAISPPLKLSLLQAEQAQLPQPFLLGQVLQPQTFLVTFLWDASSIFLVVGDPKLGTIKSFRFFGFRNAPLRVKEIPSTEAFFKRWVRTAVWNHEFQCFAGCKNLINLIKILSCF